MFKILLPLIVLALIFVVLLGVGIYQRFVVQQPAIEALQPVTLSWWRVFDDEAAVQDIITAYQALHPNVTISTRTLRFEDYEQALLEAQAQDQGPDIFSMHNTWVGKYASRLAPMPTSITLPYQYQSGSLKKEVVTELKTTPTLSPFDLREQFVDVVAQDVVRDENILALPLALDTLVLYVNRDLLNQKGIALPPATWQEFQQQVIKITEQGVGGRIVTAGAALGGSTNIPRAFDIVSALMLQNGTVMADSTGSVLFDTVPAYARGQALGPGEEALRFYTDFALPTKSTYTWNSTMPHALEAFTAGNVGFFFGYAYHLPLLRNLSPRMNLAIAPLPQLSAQGPATHYANYFLEAVSQKSRSAVWAWDFVLFAASKDRVSSYLAQVKKPPALRALVAQGSNDPDLRVQMAQVLTAKTWYHGKNAAIAERVFNDMIDQVTAGTTTPIEALRAGAARVQESYR